MACFTAAITGMLAASGSEPRPDYIAALCGTLADEGLKEERQRRYEPTEEGRNL